MDAADSRVQKYKGRCYKLNGAKVQRSWMLQTQGCKITQGGGCCKLSDAKVQAKWNQLQCTVVHTWTLSTVVIYNTK